MNGHLDFQHIGQYLLIERERIDKKTGKHTLATILGITSRTPEMLPQLQFNHAHWSIEAVHHLIDCNYDEDRGRIRVGHDPANVTRLRRGSIDGVPRSPLTW